MLFIFQSSITALTEQLIYNTTNKNRCQGFFDFFSKFFSAFFSAAKCCGHFTILIPYIFFENCATNNGVNSTLIHQSLYTTFLFT